MNNNYTDNQVLLYLYNELDPITRLEFNKQLRADFTLQERVNEYRDGINKIELKYYSPSASSVNIIMDFARKEEIEMV